MIRRCEVRSLLAAAEEHPRASLHLVTLMPESAVGVLQNVRVHSAAVWLLGEVEQRKRP